MWKQRRNETFDCRMCNFEFSGKSQLMSHNKHHGQWGGPLDSNVPILSLSDGKTSNMEVKKISKLFNNVQSKCKHCNFVTRQEDKMLLHVRALHRAISDHCKICKKVFLDIEQVEKHTETHSIKLYHCEWCKSSFKSQSLLVRHERIHTGIRPFGCTECDKTFSRKDGLKTHRVKKHG